MIYDDDINDRSIIRDACDLRDICSRGLPPGLKFPLLDKIAAKGKAMDQDEAKPTKRGIEEYPPDGFYEGYPCTCTEDCIGSCKGDCGCRACSAAYSDFGLSEY